MPVSLEVFFSMMRFLDWMIGNGWHAAVGSARSTVSDGSCTLLTYAPSVSFSGSP